MDPVPPTKKENATIGAIFFIIVIVAMLVAPFFGPFFIKLSPNVVVVSSTQHEGYREVARGYGTVIHQRGNEVFILTSGHGIKTDTKVKLYDKEYDAELLVAHNKQERNGESITINDYAIIAINCRSSFEIPELNNEVPTEGTLMVKNADVEIAGAFTENPCNLSVNIKVGHSGSGVYFKGKLVGIITNEIKYKDGTIGAIMMPIKSMEEDFRLLGAF